MKCPLEVARVFGWRRNTQRPRWSGDEGTGSDLEGDERADLVEPGGVDRWGKCRTMRRWRERYEEYGYDGLFDARTGQPSPKRVPLETAEKVLR